jgi:hypothetical protein
MALYMKTDTHFYHFSLSSTNLILDILINCNWVVTRWQYSFTHKQYTEQHK